MFGRIDGKDVRYLDGSKQPTAPAPSLDTIERIVGMLRAARRPVIMAGGGTLYSRCAPELLAFAERTGFPVLTNAKSRGMIPTNHPLWGRGFATLAPAKGQGLVPDVILMLGARFGIYTGGRRKSFIADESAVIQVDIDPGEIGRIRDAELGVAADCGETLRALLRATVGESWSDHRQWAKQLCDIGNASKTHFAEAAATEKGPIHPYRLARAVADAVPQDAIICLDGGESHSWIDMTAHSAGPGMWLGHGYVGSMGEGLPLSVGAQVAHPDKRVICFTGDGSVGFNFAEFNTMVRHGLPVVVVINNDQQWGMSAHGQDLIYGPGRRMVSELGNTRYDQAAAGFGCHAEFVEDVVDLAPALTRALAANRPACVNVLTSPEVIHPITSRFVGRAAEGAVERNFVPYADDLEA
jgi:acetolactate synthase-1/2/3 large subunit